MYTHDMAQLRAEKCQENVLKFVKVKQDFCTKIKYIYIRNLPQVFSQTNFQHYFHPTHRFFAKDFLLNINGKQWGSCWDGR